LFIGSLHPIAKLFYFVPSSNFGEETGEKMTLCGGEAHDENEDFQVFYFAEAELIPAGSKPSSFSLKNILHHPATKMPTRIGVYIA